MTTQYQQEAERMAEECAKNLAMDSAHIKPIANIILTTLNLPALLEARDGHKNSYDDDTIPPSTVRLIAMKEGARRAAQNIKNMIADNGDCDCERCNQTDFISKAILTTVEQWEIKDL